MRAMNWFKFQFKNRYHVNGTQLPADFVIESNVISVHGHATLVLCWTLVRYLDPFAGRIMWGGVGCWVVKQVNIKTALLPPIETTQTVKNDQRPAQRQQHRCLIDSSNCSTESHSFKRINQLNKFHEWSPNSEIHIVPATHHDKPRARRLPVWNTEIENETITINFIQENAATIENDN